MDLETENRIAAILLKEAAELQRQAEEEGVHAYLRKPNVRGRPNSRFLTATVLGVQQANRAVEVNEMWRVRQKELELDDRIRGRLNEDSCSIRRHGNSRDSRSRSKRYASGETNASVSCPSNKRVIQDCCRTEEEGLRDDEIEEFLHSRVKRGRGDVGSRMDETGPYLPSFPESKEKQLANPSLDFREEWECRVVLGPEKHSSLWRCESSEESAQDSRKREKKSGSSKKHSKKHRSREKSKDKNKKLKRKEKKRNKHH